MSHSQPPPPQETLQDPQVGLAQDPMELLLCAGKTCVHPPRVESVSPSPVELLQSRSAGLQSQMLWGFLLPMPDPQAWETDVGLRTLTPVGEPL